MHIDSFEIGRPTSRGTLYPTFGARVPSKSYLPSRANWGFVPKNGRVYAPSAAIGMNNRRNIALGSTTMRTCSAAPYRLLLLYMPFPYTLWHD